MEHNSCLVLCGLAKREVMFAAFVDHWVGRKAGEFIGETCLHPVTCSPQAERKRRKDKVERSKLSLSPPVDHEKGGGRKEERLVCWSLLSFFFSLLSVS